MRFWIITLLGIVMLGCSAVTSVIDTPSSHTENLRQWNRQDDHRKGLIVFVHGFDSSKTAAWGQFPDLVVGDSYFDRFNVHMFGYPTALCGERKDIQSQGELLSSFLKDVLPSYDSVIFVGHSMGGLVILYGLLTLEESNFQLLDTRQIAVLDFGTPFLGVRGANIMGLLCPNQQARDLETLNKDLNRLQVSWKRRFNLSPANGKKTPHVPLYVYWGSRDEFVTEASACAGNHAACEQVDGNHASMVKPQDREHLAYKKLKAVAKSLLPWEATYDSIYSSALSQLELGKVKEYVETLESLAANRAILDKFKPEIRIGKEADLHFQIAYELATHDHIENLPDRRERALVHLEKARILEGDKPVLLILSGYLNASDTRNPREVVIKRTVEIFEHARELIDKNYLGEEKAQIILVLDLYRGRAFYELDLSDKAHDAFREGLSVIEGHSEASKLFKDEFLYRLGALELFQRANLENALKYWNQISDPYYVNSGLVDLGADNWTQAFEAERDGDATTRLQYLKSAESALTTAMRQGHISYKLSLMLGMVYFSKEETLHAAENFEEASRLNPTDPVPLYWLGRCKYLLKNFSSAKDALERSLRLDPQNSSPHFWYGVLLRESGDTHKAAEEFKKSIELDDQFVRARVALVVSLAFIANDNQSTEGRVATFEEALRYANEGLGKEYKEADEAEPHLQTLNTVRTIVLTNLAAEYVEKQESLDLATAYIEEALKQEPDNADIALRKGWIMARQGEISTKYSEKQRQEVYARAADLISTALPKVSNDDTPTVADALYHLGYIAKLRGNDDAAKNLFMQALTKDPAHKGAKAGLK